MELMQRFLSKWFNVDYIGWENSAASGKARVFNDGTGRCFYYRYRIIDVIDEIKTENQVVWLTCPPEKYLKVD